MRRRDLTIEGKDMVIQDILEQAIIRGASDIFIVAGAMLSFKINCEIQKVADYKLMPKDTLELISQIYEIKDGNRKNVISHNEDDFSFSLKKLGRFRANIYYQRGSLAAILRVVRFELPDPDSYHIPKNVMDLAKMQKGLILVTGSAGSGKSTTLACMIDAINQSRNAHIITIEDPIEYLHSHKKSIVSQREVAHDTADYPSALKAALREAPNVLLVGEMRDLNTMQIAISAAETGHLVLSSLHTNNATETINRIIDVFDTSRQQQIRVQLAMNLQAVVSQQLIPAKDQTLVPAFEVLTMTNAIRTLIRENKLHQIPNMIATGKEYGMMAMDDAIYKLYQDGNIDRTTALLYASNPDVLSKKI